MKKIFFLLSSMNVGGVEKSFLNLLTAIPKNKYEIHLGLLNIKGGFLDSIPDYVKIHHINCFSQYWRIINDPPIPIILSLIKKGQLREAIVHMLLHCYFKITGNRYYFYKYLLRKEPHFPETFDMAVAFAGPSQMIDYYVCKKITARVKCGWIHFDVSKFGIDKGMTLQLYKNYTRVFVVSETAKQIFDATFPALSNKTELFYNIVTYKSIQELAVSGDTFDDPFNGKRILTVGRLSKEKGQDIAIDALKMLVDRGYNVKWYFVGEGRLQHAMEDKAKVYEIEDNVVFLGATTNPYRYMKDCDIYMQPSRHEGYCITLAEAICFGNPIVATNFSGAKEQLSNRCNGIVSEATSADICNAIESVLKEYNTIKYRHPNNVKNATKLLKLLNENE